MDKRDLKIVKGQTLEENIISIDLILDSWKGKLGNWITGIIPPIPMMHWCSAPSEGGIIYKAIFPTPGQISCAYVVIEKFLIKPVTFHVHVQGDVARSGIRLECDRRLSFYSPGTPWKLDAGSILEVMLEPAQGAQDIFIGFAFVPDMQASVKEHYALEAFRLLLEQQGGGNG